jgi:hypothetical protein
MGNSVQAILHKEISMLSQSLPRVAVVVLLGAFLFSAGCSSSQPGCPVCGTDKNATVGLIDVMAVPGHSASGAPGGPFNLFDISWVDPANHFFYVSDTVGTDVASFNTVNNIALVAIGGDSSIAESGFGDGTVSANRPQGDIIDGIE